MEERQLIKKIRTLKQIKPNEDWVSLTKRELFEERKGEQIISWLFTPFTRPALVVRPLVAGVLILAGVFVYLYLGVLTPQLELARLPLISNQIAETEMMKVSLGEIQTSLAEISLSLNNLKNSKNPSQVLTITEVVKATAGRGEKMVRQIKAESPSKKVLATLNEVENTFKELGEASFDIQKEMIEALLGDLEQRTLSEEDQGRLVKAREYYNKGKYTEAMILIQRIGNN